MKIPEDELHEHDGSGCYDCESCMASAMNSVPCKCPPNVKTFDMENRRLKIMFSSADLQHMFGHTAASIEGPNPKEPIHARVREMFIELSAELDDILPDSAEKGQAFLELQTAAMWFHKSLATNDLGNFSS